jgi:tRNA threonylcarbamoyladenosine biosynthesis protein TsaE
MQFPVVCRSPEEMEGLGRALAAEAGEGEVMALCGPLGAGKTRLVKGLASGMGYSGPVTSPTFALLHEYQGKRGELLHLDFYRAGRAEEIEALGWDDLLERGALVVVEWAEKFRGLMPSGCRWLEIGILPDDSRRVTLASRD